jgi:hypothetical protein
VSARLKVRALLVAKMQSLGMTALEYRDEDDAISEGDLPCVLIQQVGVVNIERIEGTAGGAAYHVASFFLSFTAKTLDEADAMMVDGNNALADDFTLGGKVQEILPVSYGEEETDGRDFAAIVLEIQVRFCTAPNDFGTLLY